MKHEYGTFKHYPLDLGALPGFEPTPLELQVMSNLAFQKWRSQGIPNLFFIGTGLAYEGFDPSKYEGTRGPLTPSQMNRYLKKEYAPEMIAIWFLSSQIRRECADLFEDEYKPEGLWGVYMAVHYERERKQLNADHQLLQDFGYWLTHNILFEGFRWERQYYELGDDVYMAQVACDLKDFRSSGTSELVLVLLNDLPQGPRQRVIDEIRGRCAEKTGANLEDEGNRFRYLPTPNCLGCDSGKRHGLYIHDDKTICHQVQAIPVIDCGSLAEIKSWISDPELRDRLDFRQLKLPRQPFRSEPEHPLLAPSLTIFDLRNFSADVRERLRHTLKTKAIPAFNREYRKQALRRDKPVVTKLIASGPKLELLVVASNGFFGYHSQWQEALGYRDVDDESEEDLQLSGKTAWFAEGLKVTGTQ